ncbi:PolC-type DNA polymerase III [Bacillus altitudinis]|uniref:3'-5' exonuclease n=1 Tax=Bacillus altitudinis TaxID=293387 RepID=UPI00227FEF40|nr:3'-5' exonuclease [Bacillus altitudinis]MCY7439400.1 3'-5' exonuclease [Bacillus altitudinis]MEC1142438.1 3'-5' exonuclease [Bacillus altitudinis]
MFPQTYVVLDLETTGLDHKKDQIIEIGAIKIQQGGRVFASTEVSRFHTMVALEEGRDLPEFITKLTGITEEDLEDAPEEWDALDDLKNFIGDAVVVAQNAPFDLSFISRGGIEPELFYCTRAMARFVEPELSASLKDVTKRNGISLDGHHRALNDVEATIEVFRRYLPEVKDEYNGFMNVVMEAPDRPLKFVPKHALIREVQMVALSKPDLLRIYQALRDNEEMSLKIGSIIERNMKGVIK